VPEVIYNKMLTKKLELGNIKYKLNKTQKLIDFEDSPNAVKRVGTRSLIK